MSSNDTTKSNEADRSSEPATPDTAGDPGRTPGSAEGDRETVESNLEGEDRSATGE